MKKITQFAVNNPVTILMFVLAILLLGYISFQKLGVDLFPNLNSPKLYIEIDAGERAPEEVENLFVQSIEAQAIRQSDVLEVSSVTRVGAAEITVSYSWDKDMDEAFLDLQKALESYAQNVDIDEINITQYDPNASPVMIVAMVNDSVSKLNDVRKVAENTVRNKLIRLEGIADVELVGEAIDEVVVETNPYKMDAFGITAAEIATQISNYNLNVSGGNIEEQGTRYNVKGVSMITTPEDLNTIIIGFVEKEMEGSTETKQVPVYLSDVVTIKVQNKEAETLVRYNGKRCLGLSIYKEPGYNTIKAVEQLNVNLAEIQKTLPGYEFIMVKNQGKFINAAIGEVKESGIYGIVLSIMVLMLFLRNTRTTMVISIAIPISIVATFTLMYFRGLTLNIMTLGGLALGAGMLVDNAIIVMENIYRHIEKGKSVLQAAITGTAEVGGAITASTITTVVVFLPIVYMHGASSELFKEQAFTVAFSLISSLVVAILVIPVLVSKFFPKHQKSNKSKTIGFSWYPKLLKSILDKRIILVLSALLILVATYLVWPMVGSEFMPKSSSDSFTVDISLPEGSSLEKTSSTMHKIEDMMLATLAPQIQSVYTQVGVSASSTSISSTIYENKARLFIRLTEQGFHQYNQVIELIDRLLSVNPDLLFTFVQDETSLQSLMGNSGAPIEVEVIGDDLTEIVNLTEEVKSIMALNTSLFNVESSIENGAPEVSVTIDRVRAGIWGVDVDAIVTQLQNRLEGTDAGEYTELGEQVDIVIRQPEVSLKELENLEIKSGQKSYRLSELATIEIQTMPREILRRNQNRIGKISAYLDQSKPFDHVVDELNSELSTISLPKNFSIKIGGEEEQRAESSSNLMFALLLSIILVYMVLASQFESLIHPFTILLTIPLALVGSIITFLALGTPFNIMAYIGMIMLVGIAVNDSIILVDAINQNKKAGMNKREAIVLAGHQRIRPIIMTSLTTILALLPLTFGFGESASLRSPMAWAVIGGLVSSTVLTLVIIPCIYLIFDRSKIQKEMLNDSGQSS